MVLTRLPPTMTGSFWRAGCWACALCRRPQPQNTTPVVAAAAPAFRKSRRVVMTIFSLTLFWAWSVPTRPGWFLVWNSAAIGGRRVSLARSVRHSTGRRQDGLWDVASAAMFRPVRTDRHRASAGHDFTY